MKKATLVQSALISNGEYPVINSGRDLYGRYDKYNNEGNAFVIAARGEYAGFINYMPSKFWAGGLCYPYRSKAEEVLTTKFIFYYLKSQEDTIRDTLVTRGSIPAINKQDVDQISIPIPPLAVQAEIVNLLDKFTQLSAELKAELKLRRKQYDYYRNHLLSFDSNSTTVQWMPLGEVAEYAKGRIAIEDIDEINYVSVENLLQDRQGVTIASSIPNMESCIRFLPNDILIGNIRPYLRKIWLADKEGGTNGDVLTVRIKSSYKESLLPRFLYHNLASESFFLFDNQHAKGAKMPRGDKNAVMQYLIPIPPMEEQERIVGILDKFETLVNDLSKGLPAEIALVQKQYEYYRNLLLTFE